MNIQSAFAPLSANEVHAANPPQPLPAWTPILPVPAIAPDLTNGLISRFAPDGYSFTAGWRYQDRTGKLLGATVRFDRTLDDGSTDKQVLPLTFCEGPNGRKDWRKRAFDVSRPLYGLDRLAQRPRDPVLVVEGEKTADAAAARFTDHVAVTSPAGSKAADRADWSVLAGRNVIIWPDADEPGQKYAAAVADLCRRAGARSVRTVVVPQDFTDGWDLADELPEGVSESALRALLDTAPRAGGDEPLPLYPELPPSEDYPVEALGPTLSRAAQAIANKIQVPAAIAAQSVLAVASLAAQAHADVRLPFGQERPLSLFLVTLAGSGDRKSSADTEALWPIRKREKALKEEYDTAIKEWSIEAGAWHAQRKKIEADKKLDYHAQMDEMRALGDEPEKPLFPFITAPDPTIEGLIKAWVNAQASLGIFTAEGGQFTGGHGMNQDNRLKSAAGFSEIWDGKTIKRVRAGDGVSILEGRRLSLHLMVQPEAAAGFLADPLLRDQGLLSRVLVVSPTSIAGTRSYKDVSPQDDAAIRAYGARMLTILEAPLPLADGKRNELQPRHLVFSMEAETIWKAFFNHVESQLGKGQDLAPIGDLAAKIAEHAARIAGILAIVEDVQAAEIGADEMTNAVLLADWYLHEALRLQQAARMDPKLIRAKTLLEWMRGTGKAIIAFSDILRLAPNGIRLKAVADEAVATLTAHGWLEEIEKRPRKLRLIEEG